MEYIVGNAGLYKITESVSINTTNHGELQVYIKHIIGYIPFSK